MHVIQFTAAIVVGLLLVGCNQQTPAPSGPKAAKGLIATPGEEVGTDSSYGILLGSLDVNSGEMVVSDPAYEAPDPSEQDGINGLLKSVRVGKWNAFVKQVDAGEGGVRCAELTAIHADQKQPLPDNWTKAEFMVGVDSGQAGLFDKATFSNDSVVPPDFFQGKTPIDEEMPWYSMCCERTLTELGAGIVPGGAVSSSGFGDGGYDCFYVQDADGQKVGIRIVFLTEADLVAE